jgi:CheY-like chemotaxis protein
MSAERLRVMVVDDNPVVAERLVDLLREDDRVTVCDRVESGLLAFARIAADRPDVVLMDLEMPGIGGLAAIRRIKAGVGPPVIVVVTLHDC